MFLYLYYLILIIIHILYIYPVGYIVGLGDRHIQNILIDKQTAEFIHIDLGQLNDKVINI